MKHKKHLYLAFLILLGAVLFVFQNKTNGFNNGHHGNLSSHGMALARNLSAVKHPLFMFTRRSLLADGQIAYAGYNRFPVFPFLLIRLGTQAFEPHLAEQIYVARLIMDLFFLMAMLVGFMLARELLQSDQQALIATLLTFSSYYLLYYSDMIFNDIPALLGFVLALLLVVKNRNERKYTFLLVLTALFVVSMGWQPIAVFVSWLLVDLVHVIRQKLFKLTSFLARPSCVATLSAIAFGVVILLLQLLNEQRVTGLPLRETDSFQSALWRFGLGASQSYAQYAEALSWASFSIQQLFRMASMIVPFADLLTGFIRLKYAVAAGLGVIAVAVALCLHTPAARSSVRAYLSAHRRVLLVMVLSGLMWSLPMRRFVVFHDFQTIFYIGIPIALFTGLGHVCHGASRVCMTIVAALFVLSVYAGNLHKTSDMPRLNGITAEFQRVGNHLPPDARVFFDVSDSTLGVGYCSLDYYAAGVIRASRDSADYCLSLNADYSGMRLTDNPHVNLFAIQRK
jgi:hypothetical protein